jgi:dTDP-4-amino-4,6-dideoxygalactose transaminase
MNAPTSAPIPLVDLTLQRDRVAGDVEAGFEQVFKETSFVLGPAVAAFEQSFAEYCGVSHVVGVGNGTDALELALRSARVGPGDEVVLPANTFVATAEAVLRTGAELVLVDCDEDYLMDVAKLGDVLTPRTRAVIPVHLYGQTAPVEKIRAVVGSEMLIVEDAAQSQGARRHGIRAGALGDIAGTSFYPGKNLGAYGDAGAVMTSDPELADRLRLLRNHGGVKKYEHVDIGMNSRLDSLQAVVLTAKLGVLDAWNAERRAAAERYESLLADTPTLVLPRTIPGNEHVFHLYVVRVPDRDGVLTHLHEAGVGAGIHYPTPLHLLPALSSAALRNSRFPTAERLAGEIISLPIFPGITTSQQERVAEVVTEAVR